jgi:predicted dehydrogenase
MPEDQKRRRFALVGTGHRGSTMWGRDLMRGWRDSLELVALCDINPLRAERSRNIIGTNAPIFTSVEATMATAKPELVIVTTRDSTHDDIIVAALEGGADVITEKPMTTTAEKIRRIRDAEKRTGRSVSVSFNYRFAPTAARLKRLLLDRAIGTLTSVDFHWYLDTKHGADYFRRWHAYVENSGSLFVHKATHHFDLLNWYIGSDPRSVSAFGVQRNYGPNGPFRGPRCRDCPHAGECNFYWDMSADPLLEALYEDPSELDGYVRDACVYREDIDIFDTMSATIRYDNDVLVSYSLNTFMPVEGNTICFNGTEGRIETRLYERQPFEVPAEDEILVIRNFGKGVERIPVPHAAGGHFGGDDRMRNLIFHGGDDPLGQRAGSRAGAMSVMVGVAALQSSRTGKMVDIAELGGIGG